MDIIYIKATKKVVGYRHPPQNLKTELANIMGSAKLGYPTKRELGVALIRDDIPPGKVVRVLDDDTVVFVDDPAILSRDTLTASLRAKLRTLDLTDDEISILGIKQEGV